MLRRQNKQWSYENVKRSVSNELDTVGPEHLHYPVAENLFSLKDPACGIMHVASMYPAVCHHIEGLSFNHPTLNSDFWRCIITL